MAKQNNTKPNRLWSKLVWASKVPFRAKLLCYRCSHTWKSAWSRICYCVFLCLSYIHEMNPETITGFEKWFFWAEVWWSALKLNPWAQLASCFALLSTLPQAVTQIPSQIHSLQTWETPNTKSSFSIRFLIYQHNNITIPDSGVLSWCTGCFLHSPWCRSWDKDSFVSGILGKSR